MSYLRRSLRCRRDASASTENDSASLRNRLPATARAKPTAEHAVIGRYLGWRWCDLTERKTPTITLQREINRAIFPAGDACPKIASGGLFGRTFR
jgi:hypothetical protein